MWARAAPVLPVSKTAAVVSQVTGVVLASPRLRVLLDGGGRLRRTRSRRCGHTTTALCALVAGRAAKCSAVLEREAQREAWGQQRHTPEGRRHLGRSSAVAGRWRRRACRAAGQGGQGTVEARRRRAAAGVARLGAHGAWRRLLAVAWQPGHCAVPTRQATGVARYCRGSVPGSSHKRRCKGPLCLGQRQWRYPECSVLIDSRNHASILCVPWLRAAMSHACAPCPGEDIRKLENGVHVVSGTPGRVFDMIQRRNLRTRHIKTLILDEADEMLAKNFKDQIYDIYR